MPSDPSSLASPTGIQEDVRRLFELSASYAEPRALWVTAHLGIADLLARGPRTAQELAQATNPRVMARPLARVLRVAASTGVLKMHPPEDPSRLEDARFELTQLGQLLRSDVPWSMRSWVRMTGRAIYESFSDLLHSTKTGEPAFEKVHGKPMYQYFRDEPEEAEAFNNAMTSYGAQSAGALKSYDFSSLFSSMGKVKGQSKLKVCDVGAGAGEVIFSILRDHADSIEGVLCDLPDIVDRAEARIAAARSSEGARLKLQNGDLQLNTAGLKLDLQRGDFFVEVPRGDCLILASIIHNWSDAQAHTILTQCRKAVSPGGRVLLVEMLIPEGNERHFAKQTDLVMLVAPGGIERTVGEYERLLSGASFRLKRVIHTPYLMSVLETEPI